MSQPHDILAVIFDFDDTLVPDSTTQLLQKAQIDTNRFWSVDVKALVSSGYDPALAYLKLLLDHIGPGKPLNGLTNAKLRAFGETLDTTFYPGIPRIFKDLKTIVKEHEGIDIEFYIISGGLEEIIRGSRVLKKYVSGIYGCRLAGDTEDGALKYIKRCVTFTEKTRYLFEINKGLKQADTRGNPYLVNRDIKENARRIPFNNMIYIGDGLTDIPCFSLVQKQNDGKAFGVFKPAEASSAKRALLEFLAPQRVTSMHAARYNKSDELGSLLRAAVGARCSDILVKRGQA